MEKESYQPSKDVRIIHIHTRKANNRISYVLCDLNREVDVYKLQSTSKVLQSTCINCAKICLRNAYNDGDLSLVAMIEARFGISYEESEDQCFI